MKDLVKDAYLFFLNQHLKSISHHSLAIFMTTMMDVYPMSNLSRCFVDEEYVKDIINRKHLTKIIRPNFRSNV